MTLQTLAAPLPRPATVSNSTLPIPEELSELEVVLPPGLNAAALEPIYRTG